MIEWLSAVTNLLFISPYSLLVCEADVVEVAYED